MTDAGSTGSVSSRTIDDIVVVARLPAEPSRHRVAVWRELRRHGAMALGGVAWAMPTDAGTDDAIAQVRVLIARCGGELLLFAASTSDTDTTRPAG